MFTWYNGHCSKLWTIEPILTTLTQLWGLLNLWFMRVNLPPPPFLWYSGCPGLVRRMPLLEQTRIGCHYLKSKNICRTKTVLINRLLFKNILCSSNVQNILSNSVIMHQFALLFSIFPLQFQLPKRCFKEGQIEPFRVIAFQMF